MSKKLTIKQGNFCNKYIECDNASEAYRFAYSCENWTKEAIYVQASKMLNNPKIILRLKELQNSNQAKMKWNRERLLEELSLLMDASIGDYLTVKTRFEIVDNKKIKYQEVVFKDFSELTHAQLKAIESIKQGRNGIELRLHSKSWTIERICKMCGYDSPAKMELTGKDGAELIPADLRRNMEDLHDDAVKLIYGDKATDRTTKSS